jgi:CRP/FNR family cyclic AMP-dependent transcriptional regulator
VDLPQVVDLLARVELFSALDERGLRQVARRCGQRTAPAGTAIFVQEELGDRMFVLAEGAVKLLLQSPQGAKLELLRHRPPAVFGELAMLDGGPRSASAEAVVESKLLVVHRAELVRLLRSDERVADAMFRSLGSMVRRTTHRVEDLAFLDLQGRVAHRLLELGDSFGKHVPPVTQGELATMVGGARQSVNLALRGLEEQGFIRNVGGRIEILDRQGLRSRTGE